MSRSRGACGEMLGVIYAGAMRLLQSEKYRQVLRCVGGLLWGLACDTSGATAADRLPPEGIVQMVHPLRTSEVTSGKKGPRGATAKRWPRQSMSTRNAAETQSNRDVVGAAEVRDEAITSEHLEAVLNRLQDRIERGE